MTLEELINEHHTQLNENDLYILNFIFQNMQLCQGKTVSEIAQLSNVSASSIIRIVQKLGFKGYSEFRYFLRNELDRKNRAKVINNNGIGSSVVLEDVTSTIRLFEQNRFVEDIYTLLATSKRIYAYATGYGQSLMLKEFSRCLINVGIHLIIIPGQIELNLISSTLGKDDLLFIISLSGNVTKIKTDIQAIQLKQTPIVSITMFSQNELSHLADYSLYYQVSNINQETRLNNSSFCTLMLLFTLLYEGYINYKKNESKL